MTEEKLPTIEIYSEDIDKRTGITARCRRIKVSAETSERATKVIEKYKKELFKEEKNDRILATKVQRRTE
jgi:hypothetical protein